MLFIPDPGTEVASGNRAIAYPFLQWRHLTAIHEPLEKGSILAHILLSMGSTSCLLDKATLAR